jgi:hypothetical protein
MQNNTPAPPELYELDPSIKNIYIKLEGKKINLFKILYKAIWNYLFPFSMLDGIALIYPIIKVLEETEPKVGLYHWFIMCKLWFLTKGGTVTIDSRNHNICHQERIRIHTLKDLGFFSRQTFDAVYPHRNCMQKTFILFTPAGIAFFKRVLRKVNKAALEDNMNAVYKEEKGFDWFLDEE